MHKILRCKEDVSDAKVRISTAISQLSSKEAAQLAAMYEQQYVACHTGTCARVTTPYGSYFMKAQIGIMKYAFA